MHRHRDRERGHGQLIMGVVLILVGGALMADRLGYWMRRDVWEYWPVILITIGAVKVLDRSAGDQRSGVWLLVLGGIFLLNTFDVLDIRDSWPLIIVAAGIMTLWKAVGPPAPPAPPTPRDAPSSPPASALGGQAGPPSRPLNSRPLRRAPPKPLPGLAAKAETGS